MNTHTHEHTSLTSGSKATLQEETFTLPFILFQQWMYPQQHQNQQNLDSRSTRMWLAPATTSTIPEGCEQDFQKLKEKNLFPPVLQVSSQILSRSRLQVSCIRGDRMWPREKALIPESLHKGLSVQRQNASDTQNNPCRAQQAHMSS